MCVADSGGADNIRETFCANSSTFDLFDTYLVSTEAQVSAGWVPMATVTGGVELLFREWVLSTSCVWACVFLRRRFAAS